MKEIKQKLKKIQIEHEESLKILISSTKFQTFLVNDILDLARLRQGKFRKLLSNFSLSESIKEVVKIHQFKADENDIQIDT